MTIRFPLRPHVQHYTTPVVDTVSLNNARINRLIKYWAYEASTYVR